MLSDWINWGIGALGLVVAVASLVAGNKARRLRSRVVYNHALDAGSTLIPSGSNPTHPRLMIVKVKNTGRAHLTNEDLSYPITVEIDRRSRILGSKIAVRSGRGTAPYDAEYLDDHTLQVAPVLMNRRDWLELRLVVDTQSRYAEVYGVIAGGSLVHRNPAKPPSWAGIIPFAFLAAVIAAETLWMTAPFTHIFGS